MTEDFKIDVKLNGNQKIVRLIKPYIDLRKGNFNAILNEDLDLADKILTPNEQYVWRKLMRLMPYDTCKDKDNYFDYVMYKKQFCKTDEHEGLSEWSYKEAVNGLVDKGYLSKVKGNCYLIYSNPNINPDTWEI